MTDDTPGEYLPADYLPAEAFEPDFHPLAHLDAIQSAPTKPVLIVEGEPAVRAATGLFPSWVVCTWRGGERGVETTLWGPLRGRDVVIWPDNDDSGLRAAIEIGLILHGKATRVRVLDVTDQPPAWNAVDAIADGWTPDRVVSWCREMVSEFTPPSVSNGHRDAPEPPRAQSQPPKFIRPDRAYGDPEPHIISSSKPMLTAQLFHDTLPEGGRILHWRGEFYSWGGAQYHVRDRVYIDQRLYRFMAACEHWKYNESLKAQELLPYNPRASAVNDVAHALRAVCYADLPEPQIWIEHYPDDPPANDLIAMRNGFLHAPTRALIPSTDRLWTTNALDFDYDPGASEPVEWLRFLDTVWGNDPQSIEALGEMFGYLLSNDTGHQKMFLMIGPSRSGKGTILRVLESLIGPHNRVAPSLASLGTQFGLQPLIGKRLAIISDARLSGRADQQPIVENLLRISGEDSITIDRKNIGSWSGKLPVRFVIAANELPSFTDASAALANRFVLFRFTESFLGREDHGLTGRLRRELPGILKWALDGLERLKTRGYLVTPDSANALAADLVDSTSNVTLFARECCTLDPALSCSRSDLFSAWRVWCKEEGRDHFGTSMSFGKQLNSAFPGIGRSQPRASGTRRNLYTGIDLNAEWLEIVRQSEVAHHRFVPAQDWHRG